MPRPVSSISLCCLPEIFSFRLFKSFIHYELIFVYGVRWGSSFILYHVNIWISQHYFWRYYLFHSLCILSAFVENLNWPYMNEFLSGLIILFRIMCLFLGQSCTVLISMKLYNVVWNQKVRCFQLCSPCLRLLWLFGIFCGSI